MGKDQEIRVEEKKHSKRFEPKKFYPNWKFDMPNETENVRPGKNSISIRLSWIPPRFNLVKLLGRLREGSSPSPQHSFPLPFHTFFRTPFCGKFQSDLIRMKMWFFALHMPLWLRYRRRQLGCTRRIDALLNRQRRCIFLLVHVVGTAFGHCALAGLAGVDIC